MKKILISIVVILIVITIFLLIVRPGGDGKFVPPKNIVFMLFDTMRSDHLGCYGHVRDTSPAMDAVAEDGIIFKNAYSQTGWTLPSVASFFTGTYPEFHTLETMKGAMPRGILTMSEYLGYVNYFCAGASNNPLISRDREMHRGFRNWLDSVRDPGLTNFGLTWLNADNINYYRMWKENYLSNYTFNDMYPNLEEQGRKFEYGYIDRTAFVTSPTKIGAGKSVILSVTHKPLQQGEYFWGLALQALTADVDVNVWLYDPALGEKGVIDKQTIRAGAEWQMHTFKLNSGMAHNKLMLFLSFAEGSSDHEVAVDDLFLLPPQKRAQDEKRFIYLHYINPHEPHKIPDFVKNYFKHEFKGNLLPDKRISLSKGDPFDLINVKFFIHKERIKSWIKLADPINVQNNGYDAEIRFMDMQVQKLVSYLKETGQYEDTMIILTADHGEEFMDHGHISHMLSVYNELIHIPIIISYPHGFPSGVEVERNIASIDVFRTFVEMFGMPEKLKSQINEQLLGRSVLDLIHGDEPEQERIIFSTDQLTRQTAAIFGSKKIIQRESDCGNKTVMFDLGSDPKETVDISKDNPKLVGNLENSIKTMKDTAVKFREKKFSQRPEIDPDEAKREKMKKAFMDLGYIDAATDVFDLSRKFEDPYCKLLNYRLIYKLYLKMSSQIMLNVF